MTWMPWAILSGLVLEAISTLIERYAFHQPAQWQVPPPFKVFQYGTFIVDYKTGRREWFFEMKLPSWQWVRYDYNRRVGWGQLRLVWTSERGWWWEYVVS